jgi:hypothetical protein
VEHFIEYKKQQAIIRKMTRKQRRDDWEKFVKSLERDITGTQRLGFKIFKQLQLQERDKLKINPISKKEWKKYYEKLWNEQGNNCEEGTEKQIRNEMINGNTNSITMKELDKALKHVKNRGSPGLDNLPMDLFKFGGNDLKVHTVELFSSTVDKSQIQQEWETGIAINIHKKGSKSKCENYRGITLLPAAYKIFTNTIKNKLNAHLEEEMEEEQCGFRKGGSWVGAIFRAQQVGEKRTEHNLALFLLFIDYEKAYDNVNRDMLWQVMEEKIPNSLLNTIKCIYENTKVSIKFNDETISDPVQINKGVKQACGLSPILFKACINKILQEFNIAINKGIQLTNRKIINTILCADDQILMAASEDELQTTAYRLNLIARNYKMNISNSSTKSMAMRGNHIQRVKIVINDSPIEKVSEFKYLGTLYRTAKLI